MAKKKSTAPATPPPSEGAGDPAAAGATNGYVHGKITPRPVEDEMKTSFIDYAMSVIVSRALPDARDGLKPVHRRILYAMSELGMTHDKAYKKSARVVGEVLGKYHPHGDIAIYDSLVRMAQDFSLRYPLIDGQGNFGSVDGDNAAAMRYTEARLATIAGELLADIDKETVHWGDNFDATLKEPLVLPSRLPNLLVNGSSGIAVGMATNIPPHNLREVCDVIAKVIEKPEATLQDLTEILKGPDFPTGGSIHGQAGIYQAYATGRGRLMVRAKTNVEEKGDRQWIIVTELPYMVNKAALLKDMASLVKDKKIEGISDLRDESDRDGMRVVIELKRGAGADVVLNQLYAHTQLQTTFGILNLALVDNKPRVLTLRQTIDTFVDHRVTVITRRTQFELKKAEARLHILEGLLIALSAIDAVIDLIRRSKSPDEASQGLQGKFKLSELQAKAILDMRLAKLTSLEIEGVKKEHAEVTELIRKLKQILGDRAEILAIIKGELADLKKRYGDDRKTVIVEEELEVEIEDMIPDEDVVVMITNEGYIKRVPLDAYRVQGRGGKGLIGIQSKEEDFPTDIFVTNTHAYIMFFTNRGQVYWLKAWRVPQMTRYAKGKAIVNLLSMQDGERVQAAIAVTSFPETEFVLFATRKGLVKKTALAAYENVRTSGIKAIALEEGDELVSVVKTDGEHEIVLSTKFGQAVRFEEKESRAMGRDTYGVKGVTLEEGDEVVSSCAVKAGAEILSITSKGWGKRTALDEYRKIARGGKGVRTIKTDHQEASREQGYVVASLDVSAGDELICTSQTGQVIRIPIETVSIQGRNTMGVRVMKVEDADELIAVTKVAREEEVERAAVVAANVPKGSVPADSKEVAAVEETLQAAGMKDDDADDEADQGPK